MGIKDVENEAFFALLQIEYLLGPAPRGLTGYHRILPDSKIGVLSNPRALDARLYLDWRESPEADVLSTMENVDLEKTVIVEALLPEAPAQIEAANCSLIEADQEPERSFYRIASNQPVVLVEFERYSPGWRAFLDGRKELEVFPSNFIFRGVLVPAGNHRVEFRYSPDSFRYGALLSAAGVIMMFLLLFTVAPQSKPKSGNKCSQPGKTASSA